MRYLKGTLEFGLCYNGDQYFKLIGYTDSDWDGSISEKKRALQDVVSVWGQP
jgi:hypothetical protein